MADWQAVFEERFTAYGWPDPASAARVAVEALAAVSPCGVGAEALAEAAAKVIKPHDRRKQRDWPPGIAELEDALAKYQQGEYESPWERVAYDLADSLRECHPKPPFEDACNRRGEVLSRFEALAVFRASRQDPT